jgi:hypothetical protein
VAFLLQFNPQWVRERRDIQRDEVAAFLARHRYHLSPASVDPIAPTFSSLTARWTRQYRQLGLTPRQWMAALTGSDFASGVRLPLATGLRAVGSRLYAATCVTAGLELATTLTCYVFAIHRRSRPWFS